MHFIQGSSRSQTHLFPVSLEEAIAEDNEVRIVDLFVTSNRRNILANPQLYKKRQAIVEHSYGTIKRQWGYSYILTKKGMEGAAADVGLIFICYNLKRLMNLMENKIKAHLKALTPFYTTNMSIKDVCCSILRLDKQHPAEIAYLKLAA